MKKLSLSSAKKKTWKIFSEYIRTKECVETCGNPFGGKCVTCGRIYDYRDLQAGHFLASRCNSILFEENGVHIQCQGCNLFKHGNIEEYYPYMLNRYGKEEVERLKRLKGTQRKFTVEELNTIYLEYKEKLKEYV